MWVDISSGMCELYFQMAAVMLSQYGGVMISFAQWSSSIKRKRCYTHLVVLVRFASVLTFGVCVSLSQEIRPIRTQYLEEELL